MKSKKNIKNINVPIGNGKIIRVNKCAVNWLNGSTDEFKESRFSDILSIGSKIYFETHLWPLLRIQGQFDEVSIELADTGKGRVSVFIN